MKLGKKDKERRNKNASSVCFLNSPEIRPEYKAEGDMKPESNEKAPQDNSDR